MARDYKRVMATALTREMTTDNTGHILQEISTDYSSQIAGDDHRLQERWPQLTREMTTDYNGHRLQEIVTYCRRDCQRLQERPEITGDSATG